MAVGRSECADTSSALVRTLAALQDDVDRGDAVTVSSDQPCAADETAAAVVTAAPAADDDDDDDDDGWLEQRG